MINNFLQRQNDYLKKKEKFFIEKNKQKQVDDSKIFRDKPKINDCSKWLKENMGSITERLTARKYKLEDIAGRNDILKNNSLVNLSITVDIQTIYHKNN